MVAVAARLRRARPYPTAPYRRSTRKSCSAPARPTENRRRRVRLAAPHFGSNPKAARNRRARRRAEWTFSWPWLLWISYSPFTAHRSTNGSRTRIVSSRSGLVDSSATGAPINSSMRRTYLIGLCRQLRPAARAARGFLPALHGFVDGRQPRLFGGVGGQMIDRAPVQSIADADLDLVEAVQHVELGQRDAVDAAGRPPSGAPAPRRTSRSGACAPSPCRIRRRARRCFSPVASVSSVGNGPSPTRVV